MQTQNSKSKTQNLKSKVQRPKSKVLFIGHDANRAGAQMLLLRWLRLLAQTSDYKILILLREGGELLADFQQVGKVWVLNQNDDSPTGIFDKIKRKIFKKASSQIVLEQIKKQKPSLIFSNTLTNGHLLEAVSGWNIPIVSYVHELQMHLEIYTTPEALAKTLKYTTHYAVCAKIAGTNLVENHGIKPQRITHLPTLAPTIDFAKLTDKEQLKDKLEISSSKKIVGMIGGVDTRKGADFFVTLAEWNPNVCFLWVGGTTQQFADNLNISSLPPNLLPIANTPNVYDYLQLFDVLALTSRMEVFPLVALEAFMMKKPVVCFADAGATHEIVGQDAGFCIADFDLTMMNEKINLLLQNPKIAIQMGEIGHQKVVNQHSPEAAFEVFEGLLHNF